MALHETCELTCPRCGEQLKGDFDSVETSIGDEGEIRTEIECPDCDTPLDIVIESTLPTEIGVDIWIEDRRDG